MLHFWGGFVDDKLDKRIIDTGFGGFGADGARRMPALFINRCDARQQYQDVRKVEIRIVSKSKKDSP